jgi:hypothetical protein
MISSCITRRAAQRAQRRALCCERRGQHMQLVSTAQHAPLHVVCMCSARLCTCKPRQRRAEHMQTRAEDVRGVLTAEHMQTTCR